MLKGFNIATSFIFIVLTLEAVSDHKKICSMKVKIFRISAELKTLYHSSTHFHKKDRKGLKKKTGIIPYRNTNNLAEDLQTNSEIPIKNEISNCIFYFLFSKTYYINFGIFYPTIPITINCKISKHKSVKLISTIRGLLSGNLVYLVEKKSKFEIEVAFLCLLYLLMASVTDLLFCTTQMTVSTCKKPRFIIIPLYLSKRQATNFCYNSGFITLGYN